jgi:hypothetical protein
MGVNMARFCLRFSLAISACFLISSVLAQSFFGFGSQNQNPNAAPTNNTNTNTGNAPVHVMSPEEFSDSVQKLNQQVNDNVKQKAMVQVQKQTALPAGSSSSTGPAVEAVTPSAPSTSTPPAQEVQTTAPPSNQLPAANPLPLPPPPSVKQPVVTQPINQPPPNQPQPYSGFGTAPSQAPAPNNSQGNTGGSWNIKY